MSRQALSALFLNIIIINLLISLFNISVPIFVSRSAWADEAQDLSKRRAQAHQEFYKGLRKLGPHPSNDQVSQLQTKTLFSTQSQWVRSLNKLIVERQAEINRTIASSLKSKFPSEFLPDWIGGPGSNSPQSVSTSGSESAPRSEPAIDGSKFPKELKFKGKKTNTPKNGSEE